MAVWQVRIEAFSPGISLPEGGWERWDGFGQLTQELDELLGPMQRVAFLRDTLVWGEAASNDIKISLADSDPILFIRIDLQDFDFDFIRGLSDVLLKFDFIVRTKNETVAPTVQNLVEILRTSDVIGFISKPQRLIDKLTVVQARGFQESTDFDYE